MPNEEYPLDMSDPHRGLGPAAATWGIYPFLAAILVGFDFVLFTGEVATGGMLTVLSVGVSVVLWLPAMLLQRYGYKDNWPLAFAKASVLCLLMAIPTPLPSAITVALGVTGGIALRAREPRAKVIDIHS